MTLAKRLILFSLFTALVAGLSLPCAAAQEAAPSGPSAQISELVFDFGDLVEGKEYLHDFRIRNVGSATLEIKKVLPG